MAGGLFSRLKNWLSLEDLSANDLNAEFNNIITNLKASKIDGTSHTVSEMQSTLNPGNIGSEVLAMNMQEEVQELRYQIGAITGAAQWYVPPVASLTTLYNQLNGLNAVPQNRIISGRKDGNDQPMFLVPSGSSPDVSLLASVTNFSTYINASATVFAADITISGLTLAPSSSNTALINDPTVAAQQSSKTKGERESVIQIKTIGSNISNLNGTYQAFKVGTEVFLGEVSLNSATLTCSFSDSSITNGGTLVSSVAHGLVQGDQISFAAGGLPSGVSSGTIYYVLYLTADKFQISATLNGSAVATTTTGSGAGTPLKNNCIKNCFRGFFFDSNDAWVSRQTVSNGATITLLKITWVFATFNSGTYGLDVVYNQPRVSFTQPVSPAVGDYWLDLSTSEWKKYSGSSYVVQQAVLIGICAQDTMNTIAARSFDFFNVFNSNNTIELAFEDTDNVVTSKLSTNISVYGSAFFFSYDNITWNTTDNLDSGVTLSALTDYWTYISNHGEAFISDVAPLERRFDLYGDYHPAKPWRAVGNFTTDVSIPANIISSSVGDYKFNGKVLPDQFVTGDKIKDGTITSSKLVDGTLDRNKLEPAPYFLGSSTGNYTTPSTTYVLIDQIAINTKGGDVLVGLTADGNQSGNSSQLIVASSGGASAQVTIQIRYETGTVLYETQIKTVASGVPELRIPPSTIFSIPTLSAGPHTVSFYVKCESGTLFSCFYSKVFARLLA